MAMKKCKECGAEVSSSAKKCPQCGKKLKHTGLIIAIIIILLIVFIAAINSDNTNNNVTTQTSSVSTEVKKEEEKKITYKEITVDKLDKDLENNAATAKDKYNNKYLAITGRLGTIDSDLKYISLLSTTDKWDIVGIHCTIKSDKQKEKIKKLKKDQTIVVKGKITDVGEVLGYYLDIDDISKK